MASVLQRAVQAAGSREVGRRHLSRPRGAAPRPRSGSPRRKPEVWGL